MSDNFFLPLCLAISQQAQITQFSFTHRNIPSSGDNLLKTDPERVRAAPDELAII